MTRQPGDRAIELERFIDRPHRTVAALAFPIMLSLVAEPLTGLVDTAFVAQEGDAALAALGVGAVLFSSLIWVFNFLGIGTQTEVAHALGTGNRAEAREAFSTALALSIAIGVGLGLLLWPVLAPMTRALGAHGAIETAAVEYLEIRLLGAPALLAMVAAFGALRGLHDMQTPFRIAVGINLLNAGLDAVFIPGIGPFPHLGIAGAAWATVVSQWLGAVLSVSTALRILGRANTIDWKRARALLHVGRDLFLRTGLLLSFILLSTRAATQIGAETGAANHLIRQVWLLTALMLDAFASTAQSLVGSFVGAGDTANARTAAAIGTRWAVATGILIAVVMIAAEAPVSAMLASSEARAQFAAAWWIAAIAQPLNAVSFATDGIHWGTRDYSYLRNAMAFASSVGIAGLWALEAGGALSLVGIWSIAALWIALRSGLGWLRIWPGIGAAPLGRHSTR